MLTRSLTCFAVITLATAATAAAGTIDREFNESFDVEPGVTLQLIHGDGDLDIQSWGEDRLEIRARYHMVSRGWGGPRDFEVDFDRQDDTITVEGREIGSNFFMGGSRSYKHEYTIKAPPYLVLELRGDDGDIEIRDWEADIDLRSDDGDVRIEGLDGNLQLQLDDGDLELFDCSVGTATLRLEDGDVTLRGGSGEWRFTLDDGDLDLRDLAATVLEVRAEDGDIEAELAAAATFEADIRTDDGDVDLGLPPGLSARFSINVDDGGISLRAPDITVESKGEHHTNGVIGDGAGELRIRTNDGDVTLRGNF